MSDKLDAKTLERMMLYDAIQWQAGLVDAVRGTEDYDAAKAILKQYRALFKRRYGEPRSALDEMLGSAELVNILDLPSADTPKDGGE